MDSPFWKGVIFVTGGIFNLGWSYGCFRRRGEPLLPRNPRMMKICGWFLIVTGIFYMFMVRG